MCNPRRSSRKRDIKNDDSNQRVNEFFNQRNSKDSSCENDKKSQKSKQTWNNVKRMRKEFSKLNKKNRGKLNVSIEMVKKTQNLKPNTSLTASQHVVNIDENTPDNTNKENEIIAVNSNEISFKDQHATPCEDMDGIAKELNLPQLTVVPKLNNNSVSNKSNNSQDKDMSYNNSTTKQRISSTTKKQEYINKTNPSLIEVNRMPFIKKSALCPKNIQVTCDNVPNTPPQETIPDSSDDIEISIKIGSTITNILIKKKNDVQVKINNDREVQTSLGPHNLDRNQTSVKDNGLHNIEISISKADSQEAQVNIKESGTIPAAADKSTTEKKNTASADTATVQFEITESVEKELSNVMEYETVEGQKETFRNVNNVSEIQHVDTAATGQENQANFEDLNDLDIFTGSVKEANVHIIQKHAPSEILISTVGNKVKTQKNAEKRNREITEDEVLPKSKKVKVTIQQTGNDKNTPPDSEPVNYDVIMGQVFASIDADMEEIRKSQDLQSIKHIENNETKSDAHKNKGLSQAQKTQMIKHASQIPNTNSQVPTKKLPECINEKHSENIFSILEKDDDHLEASTDEKMPQQVEELLTPVVCEHLDSLQDSDEPVQKTNKSVKGSENFDDSDRSVVEETPQKDLSFLKVKRTSTLNLSQMALCETKKIPSKASDQSIKSIITLTDTERESNDSNKDVTLVDPVGKKLTLETPLTITKFADHIIHKSTPVARKSLNFDNENEDNDPEQTLCSTSDIIAKTTQEKEIMSKAFESTPTTPAARPLLARNMSKAIKKFCLAASRLTSDEISKVKIVCAQLKWKYVDNYTKDITHLVVSVDEENKSQRSVKYMCALADSKWIVSFAWIERCLRTKSAVDEEYFEALDSFGEPGPRRSRIAKQKLFQGIKFYCMPPFSVLDVSTLKDMLTAAGGHVVKEIKDVRVAKDSTQPALLLAEPENTQEDRFIYLAMEHSLVPVNFEWVLNCLGSYSLGSIQELLLCPSSLLPEATARWPEVLLAQDYE
ncbi:unnamed protein product [Arctia plantaginis]|uniref:BRCT domain-containing protein n=1 Tax=Arctia plantaginis TaxID=874455 RepID=A0A8S1ANL9_ARCPL|nr:unnamed protein product [Arctia plantaginis]